VERGGQNVGARTVLKVIHRPIKFDGKDDGLFF
jgi:hypothetical protein